jgi:DNA-binding LytR/AlgR family response regulator
METQEGSTGTPDQRNQTRKSFHIREMSAMSSQRWLITLANNLEVIVSKRQAHSVRQLLSF